MSLVGPDRACRARSRRTACRTTGMLEFPRAYGFWQITSRGDPRRSRVETDAVYARDRSLGLDLRLLARTPLLFVRRSAA